MDDRRHRDTLLAIDVQCLMQLCFRLIEPHLARERPAIIDEDCSDVFVLGTIKLSPKLDRPLEVRLRFSGVPRLR